MAPALADHIPVHAPNCSQKNDPFVCTMCSHFPCWHREEDLEVTGRCKGENFEGCEAACPAFIGVVHVSDVVKENDA